MDVAKQEPFIHFWSEFRLVQSLWKAVWKFIKKLEIEMPYDPVIPLLGTVETPVH
jgi:hypothetical protein